MIAWQSLHLQGLSSAQKQQLLCRVCAAARSMNSGGSPPGTLKTSTDWVPVAASLACPSHFSNISLVGGICALGLIIIYMNRLALPVPTHPVKLYCVLSVPGIPPWEMGWGVGYNQVVLFQVSQHQSLDENKGLPYFMK